MEELENDKGEAVADEDFQRANDLQGMSLLHIQTSTNTPTLQFSDEITALRSNILASVDPRLLEDTMVRNSINIISLTFRS